VGEDGLNATGCKPNRLRRGPTPGRLPARPSSALRAEKPIHRASSGRSSGYEATRWIKGIQKVAANAFGLPLDNVRVIARFVGGAFGSKGFTWNHLLVTAAAAVVAACEELKAKLVRLASGGPEAIWPEMPVACRDSGVGPLKDSERWLPYAELLQKTKQESLQAEAGAKPGKEREAFSLLSFGALFIEVQVEPWSGRVRVNRAVGVYDVGRIVNPQLARSQLLGGITFGIGMALLEQTIPDRLTGRNVNPNLAECLIPVCVDTPAEFDLVLLDVPDPHIPGSGARGVGEIGIVGAPAAIANSVYHATGRRVRDLPITPDKLLG
jgi:xanthine dehydrogenase YagR molybdenum-binding subunit